MKKLLTFLGLCLLLVFPVKASSLQEGETPEVVFSYTLPTWAQNIVSVTKTVENGRTYFDLRHDFNKASLTNDQIEAILSQKAGIDSTYFVYYATLNVNLTNSTTYADMIMKSNSFTFAMTEATELPMDTDPGAKAKNFNFWPSLLTVAYRMNESDAWITTFDKVTTSAESMTLKERLASQLGIAEADVVSKYGKLYKFDFNADGTQHTNRFDFFGAIDGITPNATDLTTLKHLGTEYFVIRFNYVASKDLVLSTEKLEVGYTNTKEVTFTKTDTALLYDTVISSADEKIATVTVNDNKITIEGKSVGKTTVDVVVGGLKKTIEVEVKDYTVVDETALENVTTLVESVDASTIVVEISSPSKEINKDLFTEAKAANKDLVFDYGNYSVAIAGKDITNELTEDINFNLDISKTIDNEELEKYITSSEDEAQNIFIKSDYEGILPGFIKISFSDSSLEDGKTYWLYYYNADKKVLEFVSNNNEAVGTEIEVEIPGHFSTYLLSATKIADAIGNPEPRAITENPSTIDNISLYVIVGMLSCVGVVSTAVILKRRTHKI